MTGIKSFEYREFFLKRFRSTPRLSGGMADTADLKSAALKHVGSTPTSDTISEWWNGRHGRLKICCTMRAGSNPASGTKGHGELPLPRIIS